MNKDSSKRTQAIISLWTNSNDDEAMFKEDKNFKDDQAMFTEEKISMMTK